MKAPQPTCNRAVTPPRPPAAAAAAEGSRVNGASLRALWPLRHPPQPSPIRGRPLKFQAAHPAMSPAQAGLEGVPWGYSALRTLWGLLR